MDSISKKTLFNKLGLKPHQKILALCAPENYRNLLGKGSENILFVQGGGGPFQIIHFFTRSQEDLNEQFGHLKQMLLPSGILWISWPKGACLVGLTNLNENIVRKIGLENGLVDVKICSVSQDWSGLKFVYRLKDR